MEGGITTYADDERGNQSAITNEWGFVVQSYRYNANGELTFGEARYDNEYTYNGESYNPNIESQYLRARYYDVVTASFLTEDSYLGNINEPLTLNRYNYCVSSPLNYQDPSGNTIDTVIDIISIIVSAGSVIAEPSLANWGYLGWDVAAAFVPIAPGSYVAKSGKIANAAQDVISKAGPFMDEIAGIAGKIVDFAGLYVDEAVDVLQKLGDEAGELFDKGVDSLKNIGKKGSTLLDEQVENIKKFFKKDPCDFEDISDAAGDAAQIGNKADDLPNSGGQSPNGSGAPDNKPDQTPDGNNNKIGTGTTDVKDIIDNIPSHLKEYGKCDEFAQSFVDALEQKDVSYQIIRIDSEVGIYSDKAGMSIGVGYHYGIQVGDVVYDNMTPGGMKLDDWLDDLGLTQGLPDISWDYTTNIINK